MEDPVEPETEPKEPSDRTPALLVGALVIALGAPLVAVIHKRKAVIPEKDDGFQPIAAFAGPTTEAPHVRITLPKEEAPKPEPPKPAAPKPEPQPQPQLASVVTLASKPLPPPAVEPPKPEPVAAPPAKAVAKRSAKRKAVKIARAPMPKKIRLAPIFRPTVSEDLWTMPAPAQPAAQEAPSAAPPQLSAAPQPTRVRGRRAQEPVELAVDDSAPR